MLRPPFRVFLSIAIPFVSGMAAAIHTDLSLWYDMKEGLIAFLGFIAASLMQVMPITANFIQSDRLTPIEAGRLARSLTNQQHYWAGLLVATILALIFVIFLSASTKSIIESQFSWYFLTAANISCFLIAAIISFVMLKMVGLLSGMLSLHNLRVELVLESANRAAKDRKEDIQSKAANVSPELPDGYGKVIEHGK
ncbi:hypothetical protein [Pseudomonas paralcaligenes]|uniref:hypothetical protein n=1 Tax=Pseudomonas paralcaligenes TaxID=2772558 RepID=UPI001C7F1C8B|nr:hypothetical protein [Pseudomonas paralcaligenes]